MDCLLFNFISKKSLYSFTTSFPLAVKEKLADIADVIEYAIWAIGALCISNFAGGMEGCLITFAS